MENEIIMGIVWVAIFAFIYTLLDKRFKAFRMGPLYRDVFWQNYLVNFAVVGVIYIFAMFII